MNKVYPAICVGDRIKLVNHKKTKRLITNEDRTVSLSI